MVGKGKGDEGGLRAREVDSGELPSEGWQWWDREAWREDSATISLHTNAASPCQRLEFNNILNNHVVIRLELISTLASTSERANSKCFGNYKPLPGSFCRGRQVHQFSVASRMSFKMQGFEQDVGEKHLLSVGKYGSWNINRPEEVRGEKWLVGILSYCRIH